MKFKKLIKSLNKAKRTLFAVLIDPDKFDPLLIHKCAESNVDCFLVGGSYIHKGNIEQTVKKIKSISSIPVILFPGDEKQLTKSADGVFLPSLLSGRNPDYLIGKHVLMAPQIRQMKLRHVPMAYLLLEGEKTSSTQKVTKTKPLQINNKPLILNTVIAAEQLGFQLIYLEAGSGAKKSVPVSLIQLVKKNVQLPIIVGGGIDSVIKVEEYMKANVNMVVVGNALEKNLSLIEDLGTCFKKPKR